MLPKFKNETLTAVVIIVLLLMQFVLAFTGHEKINSDLLRVSAQVACQQQVAAP